MSRRLTALTLAALACVSVSGCDRRGGGQAADTSAAHASSGSAAASLPNLATPETAGRPTFQLKFGQPASFAKGGVTVTVVPKSLAPLEDPPTSLTDNYINCGSWWRSTYDISVDAQPNSTWQGWYTALSGISALKSTDKNSSSYGGRYGDIYLGGWTSQPDDLVKFFGKAGTDYERAPKTEPFHRSGTVFEYHATCVRKDGHDGPSGKPPVGVVWNQALERGQDADKRPDVAVWLL